MACDARHFRWITSFNKLWWIHLCISRDLTFPTLLQRFLGPAIPLLSHSNVQGEAQPPTPGWRSLRSVAEDVDRWIWEQRFGNPASSSLLHPSSLLSRFTQFHCSSSLFPDTSSHSSSLFLCLHDFLRIVSICRLTKIPFCVINLSCVRLMLKDCSGHLPC